MGSGKEDCFDCGRSFDHCKCEPCSGCKKHRSKCTCSNLCLQKTAWIIILILGVVISASYFNYSVMTNIYAINDLPQNFFAKYPITLARAYEYVVSMATLFWAEVIAVIVPITLLCWCDKSLRKEGSNRHIWFTRFGMSVALLAFLLVVNGVAVVLTPRATLAAGWIGLFGALVGLVATMTLGFDWRAALELTATALLFAVSLYLIVVNPSVNQITFVPGMVVVK